MRAISLWEPWGTAIREKLKAIETRHWYTNYRGPLAIHCAKTREHWDFIRDPEVRAYFESVGIVGPEHLHFGCVVATCELVDVVPTVQLIARGVSAKEQAFGNYAAGRFGWVLKNVVALKIPIPFRGAQGFFGIPEELLKAAA